MIPSPSVSGELFTVVSFAPVQGFISASRKLRDLYGSSLLLSYLARAIVRDATSRLGKDKNEDAVISPASVKASRGTPNLLVIRGDYKRGHGRQALLNAWSGVLQACRNWLEEEIRLEDFPYDWATSWHQESSHAWEYFHAQGPSIEAARKAMAIAKGRRGWSGVNWTGESSTLSGSGAICRPSMARVIDPRHLEDAKMREETKAFVDALRNRLGDAFAGEGEEMNLQELVKRLVTYNAIASDAFRGEDLAMVLPQRFGDIAESRVSCWFMADGDQVGKHLEALSKNGSAGESAALRRFSESMRNWAGSLYDGIPEQMQQKATVIYAGGDDLLGVLHSSPGDADHLTPKDLFTWIEKVFPEIWQENDQAREAAHPLTVSMGLVWAAKTVPQREALAHAREAEARAKHLGRNRFALRLLYPGGQHLEWSCRADVLPGP
ncbi:MAG: hypothetical protein ERJ68_02195 [Aphanocapsa feldmannii 277cI]|uniref:GGDEF domain-containing protein n=1 Tax=Aphanocapsa feldmannii 277cI TaxID=2507554 RepID=A0A524RUW0_9CHRO|nr:MAG: hypothetical protein ERJ68_02195 [Aphanocapsa feldmannii 277cI]